MAPLLVAFTTVFLAEMGDRTQLLSLVLVLQFRKPWPIIAGIFVATLANHAIAGIVGLWFGRIVTPAVLDSVVGISMIAMALWSLRPDTLNETAKPGGRGAFVTTLIGLFVAEIGDKTQIATMALAAGYANAVIWIVTGTTAGMLAANVPVVLLGNAFASRLPLKTIQYSASALFAIVGLYFLVNAVLLWSAHS